MMPDNEALVRLVAFGSIFSAMAIFELWSPRLSRDEMRGALKARRWFTNLAMVVISSLMMRLIFPAAAVGVALIAEARGWGLMPMIGIPPVVAGLVAFVALDFAVWLEHVVSHKWPWLWRIHRMHHADTGFDLTTALRFHPFEIILSMIWKSVVIVALGAPAVAVLVFEIVLNGMAMFNHANARLPLAIDRVARKLFVTPDMHRVHHSAIPHETDSNYGFNLSIWDRLFSTYVDQPELGHDGMVIGLNDYRGDAPARLHWALMVPFKPLRQPKKTRNQSQP